MKLATSHETPAPDAEGLTPNAEGRGRVRHTVEMLALPHPDGNVTVSIGVATVVPRSDVRPKTLITSTDDALDHAETSGWTASSRPGRKWKRRAT